MQDLLSAMFQSLGITLREGVEAALILGIVLGYLRETGRQACSRHAWRGLATAIAASLSATNPESKEIWRIT